MIEGLESLVRTTNPAWDSVTSSSATPLTNAMILRLKDAIMNDVPKPMTLLLPPPVRGMNQAARRRRRVRLASGAIMELPDGASPIVFLITKGAQW